MKRLSFFIIITTLKKPSIVPRDKTPNGILSECDSHFVSELDNGYRKHRYRNEWMDERTDSQDGRKNGKKDRSIDGWIDRQINGWMDRRIDRYMER